MTAQDGRVRSRIARVIVNHPWLTAAALAALLVIGGAIVVVSGIVSIKASSGHIAITAGILDFAKFRSVATYARGIESPPLDHESLMVRGATHYARACAPCHGGPGSPVPAVMAAMTPPPPKLPEGVSGYSPEELFFIVKHGIKFTGMPAWPAQQRDDEVWAVVAFLRRMPRLTAGEYRRLAYGEPAAVIDAPQVVTEICQQCHGFDGIGHGRGAFPILAGQRADYLHQSLLAYASRMRFSGIMTSAVAGVSDEAMRAAAEYYASLPPPASEQSQDPAVSRGAAIALRGVPDEDIPPCAECHGPGGQPRNPRYPRLAAQHAGYLSSQLRLLQERRRGGSPNVTLMQTFVDRLRPQHIRDVSLYYASATDRPAVASTHAIERR